MNIKLKNPKVIVIQEEKTKTIESLTINRIVDAPSEKVVRVFINEISQPVILWQGEEYDKIGQWTDIDIANKLNQLYNS